MGVSYETADGTAIPNKGEKVFAAVGEDGLQTEITAQVCDVSKALLSVSKVVAKGNVVAFSPKKSYIENQGTGARIYLKEQGGMYVLKMWVRNPSFPRQAEGYKP